MFIDDHIGVSIAGLASDARILWYEKKTNDSFSIK
jgi:20S proteasome alpha/beta subunit